MAYNYTYYTQEYQDYNEKLKDLDSLKAYTDQLSENVTTVSELQTKLQSDIEGMAGESYNELVQTTIGTILKQVEDTKTLLNESLKPTISSCEHLKTGLATIKEEEEQLLDKKDEKDNVEESITNILTQNNSNSDNSSDNSSSDSTDTSSQSKFNYVGLALQLTNLNTTIAQLINRCEYLKTVNDKDIELIKQFEDSIKDFSSQLFSLSLTLGSTNFEDFSNLTSEEKEELVQTFIDSLSDRYKEVSALREQCLECFDMEKMELLAQVLTGMQIGNGVSYAEVVTNARDGKFSAKDFLDLMDALTTTIYVGDEENPTQRNVVEVITGYFNGESWEESGMMYLYYLNHGEYDPSTEKKYMVEFVNTLVEDGEDCIYINGERINGLILNGKSGDISSYVDEIKEMYKNQGKLDEITDYVGTLTENYNKYNEYTYEMTTTNSAIYNMQQLKKQIPYFEYAAEEEYQNFEYDPDMFNEEWLKTHILDEGITDGYDYNELFLNMNDEEKKMFAYTLEKNDGDISAGREFLKNDASRINERVGYSKAVDFLDWIYENDQVTKSDYIDKLTGLGYSQADAAELAKDLPDEIDFSEYAWDKFCDTVSVFGKGVTSGAEEFATNIKSLWEPSKVMTVSECETSAIMQLLGDDGSPYKDDLLYASFSVGKYIGKEGVTDTLKAIPGTRIIGLVADAVENTGESRKNYYRITTEDDGESYFGSLMHAGMDTLTDVTIDAVMKTDEVKAAMGALGLSESATKTLSSAVGSVSKEEIKLTIGYGTKYAETGEAPDLQKAAGDQEKIFANAGIKAISSTLTNSATSWTDSHGLNKLDNTVKTLIDNGANAAKAANKEHVNQVSGMSDGNDYDIGAVADKAVSGWNSNSNNKYNNAGKKVTEGAGNTLHNIKEGIDNFADEHDYTDVLADMNKMKNT